MLLKMLYFWKQSTYPKELVGIKFSLMKFEHHKEELNRLWKLNRFHKMLLNLHKYHKTKEGLVGYVRIPRDIDFL